METEVPNTLFNCNTIWIQNQYASTETLWTSSSIPVIGPQHTQGCDHAAALTACNFRCTYLCKDYCIVAYLYRYSIHWIVGIDYSAYHRYPINLLQEFNRLIQERNVYNIKVPQFNLTLDSMRNIVEYISLSKWQIHPLKFQFGQSNLKLSQIRRIRSDCRRLQWVFLQFYDVSTHSVHFCHDQIESNWWAHETDKTDKVGLSMNITPSMFSNRTKNISYKYWIGLDLFNDDTRPSGHISCPTQVDVSQSCFEFPNKLLKSHYIVQVWGPVEVNKLHHIR